MHAASDYNTWLRQHLEDGGGTTDAQPAPEGGGGDTKVKVGQQKSEDRYATPDLVFKHPDATLVTYV
jgi:hypothetical protein